LINSTAQSLEQVLQAIKQQSVISLNNMVVPIKAETICIHGDGERAVQIAERISHTLQINHIAIRPIG
ncbi:MAG TPA: LamB/YcsF family protein, partial [Puia sp.]|nr:LamB/YcsF family protein [Puia sp.]